MSRRSRASVTDFALSDLSVVPGLGATERLGIVEMLYGVHHPLDRRSDVVATAVPAVALDQSIADP